jgi:hypothetical protein
MFRKVTALVVLAAFLGAAAVPAQGLPPEVMAEIRAVKLDQDLAGRTLTALEQLTAYTLEQPDWQAKVVATMKAPFYKRVEMMAADPGSSAIFRANTLGAREYMVNLLALRAAAMAATGKAPALGEAATPENTAFLKANPGLSERLARVDHRMSTAAAARPGT